MMEDTFKLREIFAPHEVRRRNDLVKFGKRLIHYTSATNAVSIFRNNTVWMRNVRCMNDYMEVEHGFQLMQRSFAPPVDSEAEKGLRAVKATMDKFLPDLFDEVVRRFDGWLPALRQQTFVTCLSEHDQSENNFGRLSMWRSYTSNQVGVGLVINPLPLYSLTESFGAFSSPVFYFGDLELRDMLFEISQNIEERRDYLVERDKDEIIGYFFVLLRAIAMCTKHPGFHEEKEWRIMHTRGLDEQGALTLNVESVNGVPQPVFKIPLKDHAQSGMLGISIPDILERVIIGPTQYPLAVYDALVIELTAIGVKDADKKVVYSNIPLRT
jgi:hypothetical protein